MTTASMNTDASILYCFPSPSAVTSSTQVSTAESRYLTVIHRNTLKDELEQRRPCVNIRELDQKKDIPWPNTTDRWVMANMLFRTAQIIKVGDTYKENRLFQRKLLNTAFDNAGAEGDYTSLTSKMRSMIKGHNEVGAE